MAFPWRKGHFSVVYMVHGSHSLSQTDAAVVGRDKAMAQDAEAFSLERITYQRDQQMILEDAARERAGGKARVLPRLIAGGGDAGGKAGMEEERQLLRVGSCQPFGKDIVEELVGGQDDWLVRF